MILFFSGTGNSRMVAERMAALLGEHTLDMSCGCQLQLRDGEPLGIVFPVYAWGVPRLVTRFLSSLPGGSPAARPFLSRKTPMAFPAGKHRGWREGGRRWAVAHPGRGGRPAPILAAGKRSCPYRPGIRRRDLKKPIA